MKQYAIGIEQTPNNYAGYVPDLPSCVATGATPEDVEAALRETIEFHIEVLREDGPPVPEPTTRVRLVEVAA
jgi:predicted RNase H-like HicB family nuclease